MEHSRLTSSNDAIATTASSSVFVYWFGSLALHGSIGEGEGKVGVHGVIVERLWYVGE